MSCPNCGNPDAISKVEAWDIAGSVRSASEPLRQSKEQIKAAATELRECLLNHETPRPFSEVLISVPLKKLNALMRQAGVDPLYE